MSLLCAFVRLWSIVTAVSVPFLLLNFLRFLWCFAYC